MNAPSKNAASRRAVGPSGHAIVWVGPGTVEALVPERRNQGSGGSQPPRFVRFDHSLEFGPELAALVASQLAEHGVVRKRMVVAIAPEWVLSKIEEVPSLSTRELELVIGRKAGQLAELEPDHISFSALALDAPDAAVRRWLLHVVARDPLVGFQQVMRANGYAIQAVVPARTAAFLTTHSASAHPSGGPADVDDPASADDAETVRNKAPGARLCLLFEKTCCSVGLISGGQLVQLSTLPGSAESFWMDVQAGRSLVQELRGIDAFWRRTSRGEQVSHVTIGGVERADVERLGPAVHSSLGDVSIEPLRQVVLSDASQEGDNSVRASLLAAIDSPRVRSLDLAVPLRPRARILVGTAAMSLAIFGSIAASFRTNLTSEAASISIQAQVTRAAAADLGEMRDLESRVKSVEDQIVNACAELEAASHVGLVADVLMAQIIACFGTDEVLLAVHAMGGTVAGGRSASGGAPSGGVVRVRGAVIDRPGRTAISLTRLEDRFRAMDGVAGVEIDLPSLSDRAGDLLGRGLPSLRFTAMIDLAAPQTVLVAQEPAPPTSGDVPLPGTESAGLSGEARR